MKCYRILFVALGWWTFGTLLGGEDAEVSSRRRPRTIPRRYDQRGIELRFDEPGGGESRERSDIRPDALRESVPQSRRQFGFDEVTSIPRLDAPQQRRGEEDDDEETRQRWLTPADLLDERDLFGEREADREESGRDGDREGRREEPPPDWERLGEQLAGDGESGDEEREREGENGNGEREVHSVRDREMPGLGLEPVVRESVTAGSEPENRPERGGESLRAGAERGVGADRVVESVLRVGDAPSPREYDDERDGRERGFRGSREQFEDAGRFARREIAPGGDGPPGREVRDRGLSRGGAEGLAAPQRARRSPEGRGSGMSPSVSPRSAGFESSMRIEPFRPAEPEPVSGPSRDFDDRSSAPSTREPMGVRGFQEESGSRFRSSPSRF